MDKFSGILSTNLDVSGQLSPENLKLSGDISPSGLKLSGSISPSGLVVTGTLSSLGLRGFSAYELSVQNGFEGTIEDWLESLKADLEVRIDGTIIYYKRDKLSDWEEFLDLSFLYDDMDVLNEELEKKQNAKEGYSLVKDEEIERLSAVDNYDDSEVRRYIKEINETIISLHESVDANIESILHDIGVLIQDTTALKNKFNKYRTAEQQDIIDEGLQEHIDRKVEKENGKSLISDSEIERLSKINNYDDTLVWEHISANRDAIEINDQRVKNLLSQKSNIGDSYTKQESDSKYLTEHQDISGKVDKIPGKVLSTNDYDNSAKQKVDAIPINPKYTDTVYDDSELRNELNNLSDRLNAVADSDDDTLDQLSEIVTYIKSNKTLIDGITTGKISVSDIVNNLTTNATNKPLSAAQGVELKKLIDTIVVPQNVSAFTNDVGYLTEHQDISGKQNVIDDIDDIRAGAVKGATAIQVEEDPTVPSWAKQENKPTYTASEVGALPDDTFIPTKMSDLVQDVETGKIDSISINGVVQVIDENKNVELHIPEITDGSIDVAKLSQEVQAKIDNKVDTIAGKGLSTNDYDENAKEKVDAIPDNPKYTDTVYDDTILSNKINVVEEKIPTTLSQLGEDPTHRLVTDTEKAAWSAKADASSMPTKLSQLEEDSAHRLITDADKEKLSKNWVSVNGKSSSFEVSTDTGEVELVTAEELNTVKTNIPTHLSQLEEDSTHRLVTDEDKAKLKKNLDDVEQIYVVLQQFRDAIANGDFDIAISILDNFLMDKGKLS